MMNRYELEIDQLATGLTKPPMIFGVPVVSFYFNSMICLLGWMFSQLFSDSSNELANILLFVFIWLGIYLTMFLISFNNPFGLRIFWINLLYFRSHSTRAFWSNLDSYQP